MKLIIAGSRVLEIDCLALESVLVIFRLADPQTIIQGGCPTGTDAWARREGAIYRIPVVEKPAEWDKYGASAGPIRNSEMTELGDILLLIWDGNSRGSADMRRKMLAAGKPVYEMILRHVK